MYFLCQVIPYQTIVGAGPVGQLAGYNLIRALMCKAAQQHELLPRTLSFKACLQFLLIMDAPPFSCLWCRLRRTPRRARHVITACVITILSGGCASNYEQRPDLSSVETIGVFLPEESNEPLEAEDVIRLYKHDLSKGEGPGKDIAAGAGTGAAAACLLTACGGGLFFLFALPDTGTSPTR